MADHRPIVLVVRDGWGANPDPSWNHANAIHCARTPVDDRLMATYPHVQIKTAGEDVGVPSGVTGNSEVGHQNIGAGRIVDQELMRISRTIRDGSFYTNVALRAVFDRAAESGGNVHLLGLCSSAGVHSTMAHCVALLELARRLGFPGERVFLHAFMDGRDSAPDHGMTALADVSARMAALGVGRVASLIGRFYAMDRDLRWDRVQRAYALLVDGLGTHYPSARAALQAHYDHPADRQMVGDEFVPPSLVVDDRGQPLATVRDGDGVIFFNFRGDRPRELVAAFREHRFPFEGPDKSGELRTMGFERGPRRDLEFCTMTAYQAGLDVSVAFPKPPKMVDILGATLAERGLRQFRAAETEKYPHVTFFFNDYRDEPFPGEERHLVASPRDVTTYDQKPEMSAEPLTAALVARIASGTDDFIVVNYANPDMVGHTGNLAAAVRAVEVVDACVGRIVAAVQERGGGLIVTADHGNCEQMIDPNTGGPHTAHTLFDVELIVVDDRYRGRTLRRGGRLADVAPTALAMLGLAVPPAMTGTPLFETGDAA